MTTPSTSPAAAKAANAVTSDAVTPNAATVADVGTTNVGTTNVGTTNVGTTNVGMATTAKAANAVAPNTATVANAATVINAGTPDAAGMATTAKAANAVTPHAATVANVGVADAAGMATTNVAGDAGDAATAANAAGVVGAGLATAADANAAADVDAATAPAVTATALGPPAEAAPTRGRRALPRPWAARFAAGLLAVVPLAVLVLAWHLLTVNQVVFWLRFDKIPGPVQVFDSLVAQLSSGTYHTDLLASLRRILTGFGLAAIAGVTVGIAVGRSRVARTALRPVIEVFRPIPAIALVPLAILLFPTGEQGIVFITFFAAFFPVAVSTVHAMHALPKVWEEAARTMGASRLSVLAHVVLPGAMPGIFSGLSVSMGVAWICVISAEMISGQFGIGYYTWQSYGLLDYAGVMVGMISIGALGWSTAWLVERIGRRVNRWLPRAVR